MNIKFNKQYCEKAGRNKATFKQREKAAYFIEHYEAPEGGSDGLRPVRSYYCPSCNGWHITHLPLLPKAAWVAERDEKVNELQVLVQRLKSEFRQADWRTWEPVVGEGMERLQYFREHPGFEKLVEGLATQLEHCSAIITTSKAKEDGSANDDFKKMRKSIEQKAKALDFDGFVQEADYMTEYFSLVPLQKALSPVNLRWFIDFAACIEDEGALEDIRYVMERADESISDSSTVPAEYLYEQVLSLVLRMDRLVLAGLPRTLWDVLQSKVKKIANVLEFCYGNQPGPDGLLLMERVRIVTVRTMLQDVPLIAGAESQEKMIATLEYLDGKLSAIPLSRQKVELMKRICEIAEVVIS